MDYKSNVSLSSSKNSTNESNKVDSANRVRITERLFADNPRWTKDKDGDTYKKYVKKYGSNIEDSGLEREPTLQNIIEKDHQIPKYLIDGETNCVRMCMSEGCRLSREMEALKKEELKPVDFADFQATAKYEVKKLSRSCKCGAPMYVFPIIDIADKWIYVLKEESKNSVELTLEVHAVDERNWHVLLMDSGKAKLPISERPFPQKETPSIKFATPMFLSKYPGMFHTAGYVELDDIDKHLWHFFLSPVQLGPKALEKLVNAKKQKQEREKSFKKLNSRKNKPEQGIDLSLQPWATTISMKFDSDSPETKYVPLVDPFAYLAQLSTLDYRSAAKVFNALSTSEVEQMKSFIAGTLAGIASSRASFLDRDPEIADNNSDEESLLPPISSFLSNQDFENAKKAMGIKETPGISNKITEKVTINDAAQYPIRSNSRKSLSELKKDAQKAAEDIKEVLKPVPDDLKKHFTGANNLAELWSQRYSKTIEYVGTELEWACARISEIIKNSLAHEIVETACLEQGDKKGFLALGLQHWMVILKDIGLSGEGRKLVKYLITSEGAHHLPGQIILKTGSGLSEAVIDEAGGYGVPSNILATLLPELMRKSENPLDEAYASFEHISREKKLLLNLTGPAAKKVATDFKAGGLKTFGTIKGFAETLKDSNGTPIKWSREVLFKIDEKILQEGYLKKIPTFKSMLKWTEGKSATKLFKAIENIEVLDDFVALYYDFSTFTKSEEKDSNWKQKMLHTKGQLEYPAKLLDFGAKRYSKYLKGRLIKDAGGDLSFGAKGLVDALDGGALKSQLTPYQLELISRNSSLKALQRAATVKWAIAGPLGIVFHATEVAGNLHDAKVSSGEGDKGKAQSSYMLATAATFGVIGAVGTTVGVGTTAAAGAGFAWVPVAGWISAGCTVGGIIWMHYFADTEMQSFARNSFLGENYGNAGPEKSDRPWMVKKSFADFNHLKGKAFDITPFKLQQEALIRLTTGFTVIACTVCDTENLIGNEVLPRPKRACLLVPKTFAPAAKYHVEFGVWTKKDNQKRHYSFYLYPETGEIKPFKKYKGLDWSSDRYVGDSGIEIRTLRDSKGLICFMFNTAWDEEVRSDVYLSARMDVDGKKNYLLPGGTDMVTVTNLSKDVDSYGYYEKSSAEGVGDWKSYEENWLTN